MSNCNFCLKNWFWRKPSKSTLDFLRESSNGNSKYCFNFDTKSQVKIFSSIWIFGQKVRFDTLCSRPTCASSSSLPPVRFQPENPPYQQKVCPFFTFTRELLQLLYMKRKRGPRSLRHYSLSMSKQITSTYLIMDFQ